MRYDRILFVLVPVAVCFRAVCSHDNSSNDDDNNSDVVVVQQSGLRYEAPDDCQWWIREPSVPLAAATTPGALPPPPPPPDIGSNEVALTCNLRTINSEFDTTNFSVIPSEHTTSLRVECNAEIMSRSSLDDRSFVHLTKLRELELENCKLGRWPAGTLVGLRDLRNLSVKTHNTDWPAMNLDFARDSFMPVRQLERLDLSCNNIWSFPEHIFCPLINMVALNVSENRLQDVGDLGFREKAPSALPPQPLISVDDEQKPQQTASNYEQMCSLDIQILDTSYNHFVLIPANGFGILRRLRELYIHNNEISMVADRALAGLKALQTFDLSNNKVVALPAELFKDCAETIKEIYLQNNSLSVLAPGLFANLEQLLALDLSRNLLSSSWINSETFAGLIRLVVLNLSFNRITKLDPSFFRDLYTLQILNLEHNSLQAIPADTFAPMNNLHTLILSFNKITYLDAYSLNGLYVLSLLALDNNHLGGVHPEAFRNCSSLQDLNLNSNTLKVVPLALKDMRLLRTVDLGENLIATLDEPSFRGLSNLYGLRLIGNQIRNVSKRSFTDLPALQILNLARNKLVHIEANSFDSSTNLQAIRLDGNQLTDVSELFANIPGLLWLNISDNQIEWFDYSMIPHGLQWLDMHKNNVHDLGNHYQLDVQIQLQTIDASFNKLTKISASSIPNSVEVVFLNDNLITVVEPHTFLKKTNLTRVDLYANQIISMDLNALRLTPVDPQRQLPEFYIGGNPFQCDCTMEWLQRINKLDHLRQHPRVMDLDSIYCKLLYSRDTSFLPLIDADSTQFLCPYKTHCFALCHCCDFDACDCEMTCPTNCTCYHDQSWSANLVDCSASSYTDVPNRIPMDATEVYLDGNDFGELTKHAFIGRKNLRILYANNSNIVAIYNHTFSGLKRLAVLHMEHNKIKELVGGELASLESLRELYLHGNLLNYIDNRTFLELKQLEVLRLDGNRLVWFEVWQFTANPYLVEIGLMDNRWSCECGYVQKYRMWLEQNSGKILDAERLQCTFSNQSRIASDADLYILRMNESSCGAYAGGSGAAVIETQVMNDYVPLMLVAVCVFLLGVVLVCGGFYYRRELRVWIYSRCGLRMCYKTTAFEEQQDKDRLFDAYISYSAKDDAFVCQMLAPGLENGDPAYRLCLHYRDFNVSAYLADTIIEAVESSRRTIVVLSKNFLHNEWCRFEFKSALHEVLKDRRRKLIFIVTGDVSQRDLDPDLRVYLKLNTVIDWSDRQFWQKLQYAMPDVRKSSCNHHHYHHPHHLHRNQRSPPPPPPPILMRNNIYATMGAATLALDSNNRVTVNNGGSGRNSATPLPQPPSAGNGGGCGNKGPPPPPPPPFQHHHTSLPRDSRQLPHPLWA